MLGAGWALSLHTAVTTVPLVRSSLVSLRSFQPYRVSCSRMHGVPSGVPAPLTRHQDWQTARLSSGNAVSIAPEATDATALERTGQAEKLRLAERKKLERAKGIAARIVTRRPHSAQELAQKLKDREFDEQTIQSAVHSLQNVGLQNDKEYAEMVARAKWRQARWAPSRITAELSRKGISKQDIDHGLRQLFGDDMRLHLDLDVDEEAGEELSEMERHLLRGVTIQADLSKGLPKEKRQRRLIMWLQRRGHDWGTVTKLLQQVDLGFSKSKAID